MTYHLDKLTWSCPTGDWHGWVNHHKRFTVALVLADDGLWWELRDHDKFIMRGTMNECRGAACREITLEQFCRHGTPMGGYYPKGVT